MINTTIHHYLLAGLATLPMAADVVFAQDQRGNGGADQRAREVSNLSRAQRSGYLGRVSESVIASGNLQVMGSVSTYADFFDDSQSVKEHIRLWHRVAIDSIALDHTPDPDNDDYSPSQGGPTRTSRAMAMVQISVFDALNSIEKRYQPYTGIFDGFEQASPHAAIAHAAHSELSALYPQQQQRLDAVLADTIAIISNFSTDEAVLAGQSLGTTVADTMRTARLEDGSDHDEPNFGDGGQVADGIFSYTGDFVNGGSTAVGEWVPDPNTPEFAGDFNLSLGAYWGNIEPFFLDSGDQFRVPAPPALDSEEYRTAYNAVAAIGGAVDNTGIPSTSTDDTRFIANYWGYDGVPLIGVPPRVYNQITAQIADGQVDDPLDYARVLALTNVGMADAAIASWDSKYYYNLWRPVSGIRIDDGIEGTVHDPDWNPVGVSVVNTEEAIRATPPFPSYPSGHATFGGVTFGVLRAMFDDDIAFTFVSDEYNGEGVDPFFPDVPRPFVPVRFQSLSEAQEQNGISRVYNGVHWEFDDTAGQELGMTIAEYLMLDTLAFSATDTTSATDTADNTDNTDNTSATDVTDNTDATVNETGLDASEQNDTRNDNPGRGAERNDNRG